MRWIILLFYNVECFGENFYKLKYRLVMFSKDYDGKIVDILVFFCWKVLFFIVINWFVIEFMLFKLSEKKLVMMRYIYRKNKLI